MDLILIVLILAVVGLKPSPSPFYQELEYIESKLYPKTMRSGNQQETGNQQQQVRPSTPPPPPPPQGNIPPRPQAPQVPQVPPPLRPQASNIPPPPPRPPSTPKPPPVSFGDPLAGSGFGSFEDILSSTLDTDAFSELQKDR